jgi:hypothetical protein
MPRPVGVLRSSPDRPNTLMNAPRSWMRRMSSMPSISERVQRSQSASTKTASLELVPPV